MNRPPLSIIAHLQSAIRIAAIGMILLGVDALCLTPTKALAAAATADTEARRVLLFADKPADPLLDRLRAEIADLGLQVLVRTHSGALEDEARAAHAIAAIRVLPSRKGVEVWMADETSGRSLLRQMIVDERPEGPDQGLIALQTAELLRTSFFPKAAAASPPAPSPAAATQATPPTSTAPAPVQTAETGIQAGIGTLYSPGGARPALQGWLSLHQFWSPHWGAALSFSFPFAGGGVSAVEGSANVGAYLAGIEVVSRFGPPKGTYTNAGIAASVGWIVSHGDNAKAPLVKASSSAVVGAAYVRVGAGWTGSFYKVGLLGLAGGAFERVQIRFAGNDAAHWGWPFLGLLVTGEIDWH